MWSRKNTNYNHFLSRKVILSLLLICTLGIVQAQDKGLDEQINDAFMPVADWWVNLVFAKVPIGGVGIPAVLLLLMIGAITFNIYFFLPGITKFKFSINILKGRYDHIDIQANGDNGEVSHFQALATAMSGTVGLGNISMVAVAICLGGPGATFWMIVAGLLSMASKFVECTLGVKYRDIDKNGHVYGGPMYYLSRGLREIGQATMGKVLSIVFAIICVGASFGGGNAFQSNQAVAQIVKQFSLEGSAVGTLLGFCFALCVGVVIVGGIKKIGSVTEKLVPIMAAIYVLAALIIIIHNWSKVDDAFYLIFSEAFTPRAGVTGGFIAVMIHGIRRAAFSNEAGAGSAAIAHSAVRTNYPASEGLVGLVEPFIDTVVVCTMTALVLVIFNLDGAFCYGVVNNGTVTLVGTGENIGGVNLTSLAFDTLMPGFSYVLVLAVILFAFSTILSWSYYGLQSWKFLFGRSKKSDLVFKLVFLCFTVLGSAVTLDAVIKFSDAMILALVFPNMIGLLFLFPKVKEELSKYLSAIRKSTIPKSPL